MQEYQFRHIVVTKYNVPISFPGADTRALRADESWLRARKQWFDSFCLPSMRAQTNRNFQWYILFEPDTPAEYTDYFSDVGTAILTTSAHEGHEKLLAHQENTSIPTITTRLDNDDGLALNYIKAVQSLGRGLMAAGDLVGIPHVINFRTGWEWDAEKGIVYERDYPASSFISLVEGAVMPQDIKFASLQHHARIHLTYPVTNIRSSNPAWLMVVHGRNVGNTIKGESINATKHDLTLHFASKVDSFNPENL
jgi:hypothetical protein